MTKQQVVCLHLGLKALAHLTLMDILPSYALTIIFNEQDIRLTLPCKWLRLL